MENGSLRKLQVAASRLLPDYLLARLDPVEMSISEGVRSFSRSLMDGERVLDAGAGECRFGPQFSRQRYLALDNCQGDPDWDYSRLHLIGDLLHLPLSNASCDAALSVVVLEHTPDPQRLLSEFRRVLKPGGRVWLVVPMIWEIHQAPYDYFRFTRYGLEHLLVGAGFDITRLVPMGGFFWVLGRYSFYFLKFWQTGLRVVLLPLLAPMFGFFVPLLCYYLDCFDRSGKYTLGYICEARKSS